ncbi:OLC1v1035668C1 [Oldenlandia corymbosa var. corymbosa]|uniref:OLC1v1035668C1 n=1 Tax=Oldenlandia corymbosa var. corymbosa TaxID=529605 RepID=A0AAV1CTI5_OLDCO|nr:OLC1v1035668C1 [Oldenlandia corymbosa var. corymbosa]
MDVVGSRFRPTQQELLWLLERKACGEEISTHTNNVLERELYGAEASKEPWNLFSDIPDNKWELYDESAGKNSHSRRVVFVVTKLSQMSAKRIGRSAGCGTWNAEMTNKPVMDLQGSKVMGYHKQLTYTVKSKARGKGSWYMHEFSLSEQVLKQPGIKSSDYVICRIVKDNSKDCKIKDSSKATSTSSARNAKMVGRKRKDSCGDVKIHNQGDYSSTEVMGSVGYPQQQIAVLSQNNGTISTTMDDESMSYSGCNEGVDEPPVIHQQEEGLPIQHNCYNNFHNNSASTSMVDGSMSYSGDEEGADRQGVHQLEEGSQQPWSGTASSSYIFCDVAPSLRSTPIHDDQPTYNLHQQPWTGTASSASTTMVDGSMSYSSYEECADRQGVHQLEEASQQPWSGTASSSNIVRDVAPPLPSPPMHDDQLTYNLHQQPWSGTACSAGTTMVDGSMSYSGYEEGADRQGVHQLDERRQQPWSGTAISPNIVCDVVPPQPIHDDQPTYNLHQQLIEMSDSFLAGWNADGMMPALFDNSDSFQVEQATDTLWNFQ